MTLQDFCPSQCFGMGPLNLPHLVDKLSVTDSIRVCSLQSQHGQPCLVGCNVWPSLEPASTIHGKECISDNT